MKSLREFETTAERLTYTKKELYENGMKCMILSTIILLLMLIMGIGTANALLPFPQTIVSIMKYLDLFGFTVGATGYLISFVIKVDNEAEE